MSRCFKTKTCEETVIFYFVKTWILESQKSSRNGNYYTKKKSFFHDGMFSCYSDPKREISFTLIIKKFEL